MDEAAPLGREEAAKQLSELKRKHDDLNNDCARLRGKLELISKRKESFFNTEELEKHSAQAREIEKLQQDLEEMNTAARTAYERRKTYEQIIHRLKEEGVTYQAELGQLDGTSKAKEHDFQLLQLMLKDASHVRDVAKQELSKVHEAINEENRQRRKALQERRRKVELKREHSQRHEKRCMARVEALIAQKEAAQARKPSNVTETSLEAEREQIAQFEEQFLQIKEVMGVSSVSEIIDKFAAQEETHATLESLSRESQQRTDAQLQARQNAAKLLETARYMGPEAARAAVAGEEAAATGAGPSKGAMQPEEMGFDAYEEALKERQTRQMAGRQRTQRLKRLSSVIVEARVAIEHLGNVMFNTAYLPADAYPLPRGSPTAPGSAPGGRGLMKLAKSASLKELSPSSSSANSPAMRRFGDRPQAEAEALQLQDLSDAQLTRALEKQAQILRRLHDTVATEEAREQAASPGGEATPLAASGAMSLADLAELPGAVEVREAMRFDSEIITHRAEVFEQAEGDVGMLAPTQGPIFKGKGENVRIKDGADVEEEEEGEEEGDPENPVDRVLDRETLKKNSERVLKKQTKIGKKGARRQTRDAADAAAQAAAEG